MVTLTKHFAFSPCYSSRSLCTFYSSKIVLKIANIKRKTKIIRLEAKTGLSIVSLHWKRLSAVSNRNCLVCWKHGH